MIKDIFIILFMCAAAYMAAQFLLAWLLNNNEKMDAMIKEYLLRHNIFNKRK